jgi:flavin reductase (DIM6/NTAB) family NADH-FMN oxidoreductase RutF
MATEAGAPEAADPGPALMRRLRGRFASGVTVVTFRTAEGLRGVTVASFATVSLEPPLVLVCIDRELESGGLLTAAGAFGVSVLAEHQELLSERFAARAPLVDAAFSGVPYFTRRTGAPLLEDALAWFDCELHATYDGGDHAITLGRVVWGQENLAAPGPLLYFTRLYGTIGNLRRP